MSKLLRTGEKKHYIYDDETFAMQDKDGNKYRLRIERDDDADSPREWDNVAKLICWHRHYNLGDEHNYSDAHEFLKYIVEQYVPNEAIIERLSSPDNKYARVENGILYGKFTIGSDWYEVGEVSELDKSTLIDELMMEDMEYLAMQADDILIVPLNLYEHSGITMSTSNDYPYNDRWDAGVVGFAYIDKATALKEMMCDESNWRERARKCIDAEVTTYDQYLTGEVYGFILEKLEHCEDRCPHCNEVLRAYDEWVEEDSCWGFYGETLEESGILDNISSDLTLID